jgi:uracil-DNA glycosylase
MWKKLARSSSTILLLTIASVNSLVIPRCTMASQKSIRSFFQASAGASSTEDNSNKRQRIEDAIAPSSLESTKGEFSDKENDSADETLGWVIEDQWKDRLKAEFTKPYFRNLTAFVNAEYKSKTVFPPKNDVFNAFRLTPFDDIKVVVIGQDPYHGDRQAHGLCFSVQKGVQIPPSLRNMIEELKADPATRIRQPGHGNLECWAKQGVLLLNTCLTVRRGEANSHQKKGWEEFTDAVIRQLAARENIVYLLWGLPAQTK